MKATVALWQMFNEMDILWDIRRRADKNSDEYLAIVVAMFCDAYPNDVQAKVIIEELNKAIPYVLASPEYSSMLIDPDYAPFLEDLPRLVAKWQKENGLA